MARFGLFPDLFEQATSVCDACIAESLVHSPSWPSRGESPSAPLVRGAWALVHDLATEGRLTREACAMYGIAVAAAERRRMHDDALWADRFWDSLKDTVDSVVTVLDGGPDPSAIERLAPSVVPRLVAEAFPLVLMELSDGHAQKAVSRLAGFWKARSQDAMLPVFLLNAHSGELRTEVLELLLKHSLAALIAAGGFAIEDQADAVGDVVSSAAAEFEAVYLPPQTASAVMDELFAERSPLLDYGFRAMQFAQPESVSEAEFALLEAVILKDDRVFRVSFRLNKADFPAQAAALRRALESIRFPPAAAASHP